MRALVSAFALYAMLAPLTAQATGTDCSVSAVGLVFGSYSPFRLGPIDTTGNIAVTCNGTPGDVVSYTIMLNAGSSGAFAQRRMAAHARHTLNYNIYTSASRAIVWGDGNNGSQVVADSYTQSAARVTRNYPVYARIFGGQNAHIGTYLDSIVVTLSF